MEWKELYQVIEKQQDEVLSVENYVITRTLIGQGQYGKVYLGYPSN